MCSRAFLSPFLILAANSISSAGVNSFTWPISRRYNLNAVSPSYPPRSREGGVSLTLTASRGTLAKSSVTAPPLAASACRRRLPALVRFGAAAGASASALAEAGFFDAAFRVCLRTAILERRFLDARLLHRQANNELKTPVGRDLSDCEITT